MQHGLLRTELDRQGSTAKVALFGEVDLSTREEPCTALAELAADPAVSHIVLDLRGVTFLDSSGLGMVVTADRAARRDGFNLTVVKGPPTVQRVFTLTAMDHHLAMVDDPNDSFPLP